MCYRPFPGFGRVRQTAGAASAAGAAVLRTCFWAPPGRSEYGGRPPAPLAGLPCAARGSFYYAIIREKKQSKSMRPPRGACPSNSTGPSFSISAGTAGPQAAGKSPQAPAPSKPPSPWAAAGPSLRTARPAAAAPRRSARPASSVRPGSAARRPALLFPAAPAGPDHTTKGYPRPIQRAPRPHAEAGSCPRTVAKKYCPAR